MLGIPLHSGESPHWTQYFYDALDRVIAVTEPGDRSTVTQYTGLTTVTTNAEGQTSTQVADLRVQVVEEHDALGHRTVREFGAFGNLLRVIDPGGNQTSMDYDTLGRVALRKDQNRGLQHSWYNVVGELVMRQDGGNFTTMSYDKLGRMLTRRLHEGLKTWTYDTAAHGIGKLARAASPAVTEDCSYDSLGRLAATTTRVAGQTYVSTQSYDEFSRPATYSYPSGFSLRNVYDAVGNLSELRNAAGDARFFTVLAQDAHGRVTHEQWGNGIATQRHYDHLSGDLTALQTGAAAGAEIQNHAPRFDVVGNLESRRDLNTGLDESFSYDPLNRLLSVSGPVSTNFEYDAIGNLVYASDLGRFEYLGSDRPARPHAVKRVAGMNFSYDANGKITRIADEAGVVHGCVPRG